MNRTFTLILTIAMVGGLTVIGFAGTAVAQESDSGATEASSGDWTVTAVVDQDQTVQQSNTATVDQRADQEAESGDSGIDLAINLGDGNGFPGGGTG